MGAFRMRKINIDQFAILANEAVSGEISIDISVGFKYSAEGKRIACAVDIKYEKDATAIMLLKLVCEFVVPDEDWEKYYSNGEFSIPKDLQEALAAQVIGTSRGVLFCKTEGTPFSNLVLPPINVVALLDD